MDSIHLLVPFAGACERQKYLFNMTVGMIPFVRSLSGLKYSKWGRICIVLQKENSIRFGLEEKLRSAFAQTQWKENLEILLLSEPTQSQPETIAEAIQQLDLSGSFWVKDPDNYFSCELIADNVVSAFPLDALTQVNPQNKSYLSISDADYVMNIAEKRIIGRYFCTGGYGFFDTEKYMQTYKKLKKYKQIYLSHIIYRMLLDGEAFRPIYVSDYADWGTEADWNRCITGTNQ